MPYIVDVLNKKAQYEVSVETVCFRQKSFISGVSPSSAVGKGTRTAEAELLSQTYCFLGNLVYFYYICKITYFGYSIYSSSALCISVYSSDLYIYILQIQIYIFFKSIHFLYRLSLHSSDLYLYIFSSIYSSDLY